MSEDPPWKSAYTFVPELLERAERPETGVAVTKLYESEDVEAFLLALAEGEELPEHVARRAVVLQVLEGHVDLGLENDRYQVGPGAWVHMRAEVPHGVKAEGPAVLLVLRVGRDEP